MAKSQPRGTTGLAAWQVGTLPSLLLADPHLGVVRLWLLLLHVCTVLFKRVVLGIRKPQELQGEKRSSGEPQKPQAGRPPPRHLFQTEQRFKDSAQQP